MCDIFNVINPAWGLESRHFEGFLNDNLTLWMRRHLHSDDADQHITHIYWSSTLTYPRPPKDSRLNLLFLQTNLYGKTCRSNFKADLKDHLFGNPTKTCLQRRHTGEPPVSSLFTLFLALSADIYRAGNPSVPHRVSENSTVKIRTNSLTSYSSSLSFSFLGNITWSATVLYIYIYI